MNQRFALLYPERRPFFLEGGQFFRSAGALNFLNTRQIVDPDWGAKLTTKSGANTIAPLAAQDAAPGRAAAPARPGTGAGHSSSSRATSETSSATPPPSPSAWAP